MLRSLFLIISDSLAGWAALFTLLADLASADGGGGYK